MSILLYALGRAIARHRGMVVALWFLVLVAIGGAAATLGDRYDDSFSIPGTQSQEGQDLLGERFGLTGAAGQILFEAKKGKITDQDNAAEVASLVKAIDKVDGVSLNNPLSATTPTLNKSATATLTQIQFADKVPSDETLDEVQEAGTPKASAPVTTSIGGDAYKYTSDPSKVPELLGLLVSFFILVATFRALIPAGMPILTSLVGVAVTITSVMVTSHGITVSSTAPTLAEMLGLAVGIDYALFILSRHRAQLAEGLDVVESMSRALATAGSAVVFAGTTVIIALGGLAVAGIPVLTVMGAGAAFAVAVAVSVALTLLPAIALLLGERLRPRPRKPRRPRSRKKTARPASAPTAPHGVAVRWVRTVTKVPVLTVVAVVVLLGLAAVPALDLRLALPDNSTAPEGTPARTTYDDITRAFGEGYNAPLAVVADIITSTSPQDTVSDLADAIRKVPGVVAVPQSTPDQGGDTALVQVIPEGGQTDPATADLVTELRTQAPALEKEYGVSDIMVTGQTAANIDASDRLGAALLPFGSIVIGLSLVLLMVVFRSVAVPLKATLGYLLSVGAALGAVVAIFQWGWADSVVPGLAEGPIVSFLPIFVMGVLFGLAMDYEMFLVSAMREHFVLSGDPHEAVHDGFRASARVVTAAALIMTSVFIAFVPAGTATIKQIALGLAVGVFVDAFIVRMTLVPAVLMLLRRRAWWLPGGLARGLPEVDVEGAALHRKVAYDDFRATHDGIMLLAREIAAEPGGPVVEVAARAGEVGHVAVPAGADPTAIARVLAGRRPAAGGELVVDGLLLPEQREAVIQRTALLDLAALDRSEGSVEDRVRDRVRMLSLSRRRRDELAARAQQQVRELASVVTPRGAGGAIASAVVEAGLGLTQEVDVFVLSGLEGLPDVDRGSAELLARTLADRGATVLVVSGSTEPMLVPASHRSTADQAPVPDVDGSVRTTR
ncbi:MAG TPA: MMPL family transporter [Nocardioides sp.]|uniref:MMPL family transporter n=1 Tax=Nocardioides sp. TaxID=35761 RepID=UPI002E370F6F|nr:MMPL family transporter [Nocardioides sp.]HEX5088473.1 MMPL family transporter [Nocardioides sp.]